MRGLHHVFRLSGSIYSGSQPDDAKALAELVRLGIKTIVSVDGSRPNAEAAAALGLRYVHLPIDYGGISPERTEQLVKVALTVEGPIYVHCHHGQHRGPAAAAVMCEAVANWNATNADAWLKQAGTSPDYPGLFRAVREFRLPSDETLSRVSPDFPSVAPVPPLVDAMVEIDERFDRLKTAQKNRWNPDAGAKAPADWFQDSILLHEHFRELTRAAHDSKGSADWREQMARASSETEAFADVLRVYAARVTNANRDAVEASFQKVELQCADCHRAHRNGTPSPSPASATHFADHH